MYNEEDLLPLSGLQHFFYCKRQCALIHLEQQWADNYFTAKGIVMHDKAHSNIKSARKGIITERGLFIKSRVLGLIGKTDIVEFHKNGTVLPVEYKSGKAKKDNTDKVQLCAQAVCLEEMLNVNIERGAIFYGKTHSRQDVVFDKPLRDETKELACGFHKLIESKITPKADCCKKCGNCSFKELCLPDLFLRKQSVKKYLREKINNEKIT